MAQVAVMAVMAAVAAYMTYRQGQAQEEGMKAEGAYQEFEGELKMVQAQREADKHRKAVRRLIATQNAHMAASGVQIGSGSPLQLVLETAWEGEMDAQDIIYAGKLGQETSNMAGRTSRMRGKLARQGAGYAALGTLATGLAGAAGTAMKSSGPSTTTTTTTE